MPWRFSSWGLPSAAAECSATFAPIRPARDDARRHLREGFHSSRTLVLISLLTLALVTAVSAGAKKRRRALHDRLRPLAHVRGGFATHSRYGRRAARRQPPARTSRTRRSGTDTIRAATTAATTTTAAPTWSARRSRRRSHDRFGFTEAIPSWNASHARPARWIETLIRAQIADRWTKWYSLGVWASGEYRHVSRHSVRLQGRYRRVRRDRHARPERQEGAAGGRLPDEAPALQHANGTAPSVRFLSVAVVDGGAERAEHARADVPVSRATRCSPCPSTRRWSIRTAAMSGAARRRSRWCWPTGTAISGRTRRLGANRNSCAQGRRRRLRLDLRRTRQLAVQHGVRRHEGMEASRSPASPR